MLFAFACDGATFLTLHDRLCDAEEIHAALDRIAAMSVHVVCTGHDHEERTEVVQRTTGRFLASAANTLSSRSRKHRPSALNVIEATDTQVTARAWTYQGGAFVPGPMSATLDRR